MSRYDFNCFPMYLFQTLQICPFMGTAKVTNCLLEVAFKKQTKHVRRNLSSGCLLQGNRLFFHKPAKDWQADKLQWSVLWSFCCCTHFSHQLVTFTLQRSSPPIASSNISPLCWFHCIFFSPCLTTLSFLSFPHSQCLSFLMLIHLWSFTALSALSFSLSPLFSCISPALLLSLITS